MAQENEQIVNDERQSQLATVLIGILIVVAGFLIYSVFSNETVDTGEDVTIPDETISEDTATPTQTPTAEEPQGGTTYVVQTGDTLWEIAERAYGDGYQWTAIADANNISRTAPSVDEGTELTIPPLGGPQEEPDSEDPTPTPTTADSQEEEPTLEPTTTPTPEPTITPEPTPTPGESGETPDTTQQTYTVVEGDTLWEIAEEFYGSGFEWQRIFDADENNIEMYTSSMGTIYPLIEVGDVLVIPAQ